MMIFHNTKETVTRIGYLTMINPKRIYCAACQEHLNEALDTAALELDKENKNYFADYETAWELANYNVQLKPTMPSITIGNMKTETTVAPHVKHSWFKFLPTSLTYDKSIWDGKM
eukprot:12926503-Ditylum_brightwellii.AAC.1